MRAAAPTRAATRCLLVADDLTGAADGCAKFVVHGYSGTVLLRLDAEADENTADAHIVAVNLDTRRLSHTDAATRVSQTSRFATHAGQPPEVFKKIDSTLRGHVGTEIAAALHTFGCTHAIVAPAFPAMGRTVREGRLIVAGADTGAAGDILTLLADQGVRGAIDVSPPASGGTDAVRTLRTSIARALATEARVLVFDAGSDGDLDDIVTASRQVGGRPLWVGSAGLAEALAAQLAACDRPKPGRLHIRHGSGPVLLCIGSTHPTTRGQLERLQRERRVDVIGSPSHGARVDRDRQRSGGHLLIDMAADERSPSGLQLACDAAELEELAGLVLSGGDTAADVCAALGATAIRVGGEVASGVPWGVLEGGRADGRPVVLKAGGFGAEGALVTGVDFLASGIEHVRA